MSESRRVEPLPVRVPAPLDVEALPRRVAHATHAVMAVCNDQDLGPYGPFRASEVVLYDGESLSARETGRALADASRLGLVMNWGRRGGRCFWSASAHALDHRRAFEDRYLRDTDEGA